MSNMQKNRNVPFWWRTGINFFELLHTANALNVKRGGIIDVRALYK